MVYYVHVPVCFTHAKSFCKKRKKNPVLASFIVVQLVKYFVL